MASLRSPLADPDSVPLEAVIATMTKNWEASEELHDRICLRISEGESLRQICKDADMPSRATVFRWLEHDPIFETKRARASALQGDWLFDEMSEIEDGTLSGKIDPTVARVVLSSKQWRAAKLAPKKYGDKTTVENTGPGGGPIQSVGITTSDPIEAAKVYQRLIGGK